MSKEIIFATKNEGKVREIREILEGSTFSVVSMREKNIDIEIIEDGATYEENALIKARTISKLTGQIVLADDSGLEIDYMDQAPGIYSARYLGEDTSYTIKNNYILEQLKEVEKDRRGARFICAIAAVFPSGEEITTRGIMEGEIGEKVAGGGGFGYDPIFYLPQFQCTSAELTMEQKNKISHRGVALRKMRDILLDFKEK